MSLSMEDRDRCFEERKIIVLHGCPLNYQWDWNSESLDQIVDIHSPVEVQGKLTINFLF